MLDEPVFFRVRNISEVLGTVINFFIGNLTEGLKVRKCYKEFAATKGGEALVLKYSEIAEPNIIIQEAINVLHYTEYNTIGIKQLS